MTEKQEKYFWERVQKTKTCWLWIGPLTYKGYGRSRKILGESAHRFSFREFKGPIADGLCVCHKCDIRNCVNPEHLFLGTNLDNVKDRDIKGRQNHPYGIRNPNVKLSENQVKRIRLEYPGKNQTTLALEYGVSCNCIHDIVRKKMWLSI